MKNQPLRGEPGFKVKLILSLEEVLCGYTYLQVSYKVNLLSMKARQAREGTQVQETEDREKEQSRGQPQRTT